MEQIDNEKTEQKEKEKGIGTNLKEKASKQLDQRLFIVVNHLLDCLKCVSLPRARSYSFQSSRYELKASL